MTTNFSKKHALLISIAAVVICFTMLLGTTYAWFTDSATSSYNKIQAGTLKIDLALYDAEDDAYESIKESKAPVFNYAKWEPGYTDVKLLKVENKGTLALKWKATLVTSGALSELANVIDVYVCPSPTAALTMPTDRDLTGYTRVGTLAEFVNTLEVTTYGELSPEGTAGDEAYLGIALVMQTGAGNNYQGMDLGEFDICVVATQLEYETDSIDTTYDEDATYPDPTAP